MDTPLIISSVAHVALILFLLFGGQFHRAEPPDVESTEVTVLSEEEFAALTRAEVGETPPPPPMVEAEEPSAAIDPEAPEDQPPPEAPRVVEPAPAPEPEPEPEPTPEPEPEPAPVPAPDPEPSPDPAPPEPGPLDDTNTPRPAPRVADEVTPEPPVDAEIAETQDEAVAPEPDDTAAEVVEEEAPEAPPEATTEIVTEAEEPSSTAADAAPDASARPRGRPERLAAVEPEPEPEPEPAPQTPGETATASSDNLQSAINDTLAGLEERVEQGTLQGAPAGPPLTQGEKEGFRLQVRRCWNVDVGSEAANVVITIRFNLTPDAQVVPGSLEQVSATGGSAEAIRTAFDWGRRAILRCQVEGGGYQLPAEKYAQWQQVEVTFNPSEMRIR